MITKELFNTLSQLDRIEFRQKREAIEINYNSNAFGSLFYFFTILGFLSAILTSTLYGITGFNCFIQSLLDSSIFIAAIFGLTLLIDMASLIRKNNAYKELTEDYFNIKVTLNEKTKKRR